MLVCLYTSSMLVAVSPLNQSNAAVQHAGTCIYQAPNMTVSLMQRQGIYTQPPQTKTSPHDMHQLTGSMLVAICIAAMKHPVTGIMRM